MSDAAPKRRWFRFSLRTLFVVVTISAVVLGWRAYSLNWIQERQKAGVLAEPPWDVPRIVVGSEEGSAPGLLWLFGERGYDRLRIAFPDEADKHRLSNEQQQVLERIRSLYPEATVEVVPPYTGESI